MNINTCYFNALNFDDNQIKNWHNKYNNRCGRQNNTITIDCWIIILIDIS